MKSPLLIALALLAVSLVAAFSVALLNSPDTSRRELEFIRDDGKRVRIVSPNGPNGEHYYYVNGELQTHVCPNRIGGYELHRDQP